LYRQIVVGTDGSDTAAEALRQAIDLAAALGARLDIVSAFGRPSTRTDHEGQVPTDVSHEVGEREDANMILSVAASLARESGVETTTEAISADAREAILDAAARTGADLIVVGNRGMSGARRILGSVPNAISHHAPCSVMIVATT
jgi:nucleotide-binding universal stress UspA family protein